jgi:hypothetical protein
MTGTPAAHGPGYVVRMRCGGGGLTYASIRMTKTQAESTAEQYEQQLLGLHPATFLHFTSDQGLVRLRAERVTAIEVLRTLFPGPANGRGQAVPARAEVETR